MVTSAEWRFRQRDPDDNFSRPWETPLKPQRHIQHGQQVGGSLHTVASPDNNGFMSAADKAILDGFAASPMTRRIVTMASSAAGGSGLRITPGVVATTPVDGDINLTTGTSFSIRMSGTTYFGMFLNLAQTITAKKTFNPSATGGAMLNIGTGGTAPSSPSNGDMWMTTSDVLVRANGVTETVAFISDIFGLGTAFDAGTKSTGTFTPSPASGLAQKAVNDGAHTLAPPSPVTGDTLRMILLYTNGASAGAVTTTGFTKVTGTFTTTNTHKFVLEITIIAGSSLLEIKPLQ